MIVSPNLGLKIWNLSTDPYNSSQLAENLAKIDEHDHSNGRGKQIPTGAIADGAITNAKLDPSLTLVPSNDTVSAAKIQTGAVTNTKIFDSAVTTTKINDGAVTTAKIADSNVTAAKLGSDAVTTVKILNSNVTTAKIADLNVTLGKLDTTLAQQLGLNAARATIATTVGTEFTTTSTSLVDVHASASTTITAPAAGPALILWGFSIDAKNSQAGSGQSTPTLILGSQTLISYNINTTSYTTYTSGGIAYVNGTGSLTLKWQELAASGNTAYIKNIKTFAIILTP